MRPDILLRSALLTTAALVVSSCILEAPDDDFYRTLWKSSPAGISIGTGQNPPTPPALPAEGIDDKAREYTSDGTGQITLEFLCGQNISIKASDAAGSIGTYSHSGSTASLERVTLTTPEDTCIFTEAHRNGDRLTLLWHSISDNTEYAIEMHRLSAYE